MVCKEHTYRIFQDKNAKDIVTFYCVHCLELKKIARDKNGSLPYTGVKYD